MLRRLFVTILILAGTVAPATAAGIEYVTVQAEGSATTLGGAIASALKEAVTQVNGAQLAATTLSSEAMAAMDTQNESSFASASTSAEQIAMQTKGVIREYRILSKAKDVSVWTVNVDVTVSKYARSEQADRLRAAVVPFRLSKAGQAGFRDAFVQGLTSRLTQSRKFAILDRQYGAEQDAELDRLSGAGTPVEEMAKLGNKLGTDLLIVGTVEEAGVATHSVTIASINKTLETSQTTVRLSYRVIDAATGQIKFSDTWTHSQEGAAIAGLAERAGDEISRQILESIFPVMVESINGDMLFLGQGGKSIQVGQRYRLIRYGKTIVDSYTKESLGREETEVGIIEVVDVQAKVAKAKVVKAQIDLAKEFAPSSYIARLSAEARPAGQGSAAPSPAAVAAKHEKRAESVQKSAEKDW